MKVINKIILIWALIMTGHFAWSAEKPSIDTQDTDIAPIREYFSHFVRKVQQPFYLYHWRRDPNLVGSVDVQRNPQKNGREIVEAEVPSFIPGLYVKNDRTRSSLYGGGLYAALDPVVTELYGGGDPESWALLAMHIPIGFQMLDLRTPEPKLTDEQEKKLRQALVRHNCPDNLNVHGAYLRYLLQMYSIPSKCADLIANLITTFNVDGFLYRYDTTPFGICQNETDRGLAVVFTSSDWLNKNGSDARIYTFRTSSDSEERKKIENIFLYNSFAANKANLAESNVRDFDQFRSIHYFNRSLIQSEKIARPRYHWKDLISSDVPNNPEHWIQQNIFECGNAEFLANPLRIGNE